MNKKLDKFFMISDRGSSVKTEIIGGLTTFFAMAYIVVTAPNQITGGVSGALWNAVYIASLLAAVVGTLLYAFYAKLPFAQACGVGLCPFFFVSFILPNMLDPIKGYQEGLLIVLIAGIVFLLLSVTGARKYIARSLPDCLKKSIPAGIGLFIALIGFANANIIVASPFTMVQLFDFHAAIDGLSFFDAWKAIAPVVLALLGLFLIAILEKKGIKSAIIVSILSVTVLYYLTTWTAPNFDFASVGQAFKDFGELGFLGAFKGFSVFSGGISAVVNAIVLIITFCLVDMFDTIGTLYGTAAQADMLDENGDPQNIDASMTADSIATASGSLLGTSTCTTFVESASGVAAGARTGLASVVTAICFALCLFLTPLALIVPACATAPALIYVGVLMLKGFSKVDMSDPTEAVPAFLTLVMMPLTYSISNGIAIGAIAYTVTAIATGRFKKRDLIVLAIGILFLIRFFTISV
ncbi:MAG: NCS2 family permease [Clostridia bacterium]|nr:NCS2 family permease [Clostridia bacterium]